MLCRKAKIIQSPALPISKLIGREIWINAEDPITVTEPKTSEGTLSYKIPYHYKPGDERQMYFPVHYLQVLPEEEEIDSFLSWEEWVKG